MQTSPYTRAVPAILAEMEQSREADDREHQPDRQDKPGSGAAEKLFVYRTDTGGWLISPTKIQKGEQDLSLEHDQPYPPIIDSQQPEADQRPTTRRQPPYFLHFLLILFIFMGLDNLDAVLAQFAPTASVTITLAVKTITTNATFPIGTGPGDVQGRVLPALTLSQSQTVAATGKGHQDATRAGGNLLFFNGSFAPQTIDAGTVYTGRDGVQVATDHTITIAAANPPYVGQATVGATAIHAGAQGNIQAGDISMTTATLQVSNSQFSGGKSARDFTFVTEGDIQQATHATIPLLLQSEQGALTGQLQTGEDLTTPTCTPSVLSSKHPGDEAASAQVTASETCRAIAYSQQSLQAVAAQLVRGRLTHPDRGYQLVGTIQITVRSVSLQNGNPTLTATLHGVGVYQISESQVKTLVAGKPRLIAIELLQKLPGVRTASISGIADNQRLPSDAAHIYLSILYLAS
jgi:Baseplate J-like protein